MKVQIVGIPWYRKEDYAKLLTLFEDADNMPDTYEDWLAKAKEARETFERHGATCIEALIEPNQFPGWCAENGHKLNAQGRAVFARERAKQSNWSSTI